MANRLPHRQVWSDGDWCGTKPRKPRFTTLAIGEESTGPRPPVSTMAIGEESGGPIFTTLAIGEESGGFTI